MTTLKTIVIGAVSTVVIATGGVIYAQSQIKPEVTKKETPKMVQKETSQTTTETIAAPEMVNTPESTPPAQETAPATPTQHVVPSIEELKAQYGWDIMEGAIEYYMQRDARYFEEPTREAAFKYMADVSREYSKKMGSDPNLPGNRCYGWHQLYKQSQNWESVGGPVGVRWSDYING